MHWQQVEDGSEIGLWIRIYLLRNHVIHYNFVIRYVHLKVDKAHNLPLLFLACLFSSRVSSFQPRQYSSYSDGWRYRNEEEESYHIMDESLYYMCICSWCDAHLYPRNHGSKLTKHCLHINNPCCGSNWWYFLDLQDQISSMSHEPISRCFKRDIGWYHRESSRVVFLPAGLV